jgi:hypothetical protein
MRTQKVSVGTSLSLCLLAIAGTAAGQDKKDLPQDFLKYSQPGAEHKALGALVGTWKTAVKFYPGPGKSPQESTGTMTMKWVLGERYVAQHYKGSFGDQPFEGLGLMGYDTREKKYTSTWADSMSTSVMSSRGSYDAAKKTFTFHDEVFDPYVGVKVKTRDVMRVVDADTLTQEMYRRTPEAKEDFKVMEISYKREKK